MKRTMLTILLFATLLYSQKVGQEYCHKECPKLVYKIKGIRVYESGDTLVLLKKRFFESVRFKEIKEFRKHYILNKYKILQKL